MLVLATSMLCNDAVRHLIGVASYAAVPIGTAKWQEKGLPRRNHPAVGREYKENIMYDIAYPRAGFPTYLIFDSSHFETPNGVSA